MLRLVILYSTIAIALLTLAACLIRQRLSTLRDPKLDARIKRNATQLRKRIKADPVDHAALNRVGAKNWAEIEAAQRRQASKLLKEPRRKRLRVVERDRATG